MVKDLLEHFRSGALTISQGVLYREVRVESSTVNVACALLEAGASELEEVVTSSALCIRLGSLHFIQECTGESDLVSGVFETVGAEPVVEEGVVLFLSDAELFPVER